MKKIFAVALVFACLLAAGIFLLLHRQGKQNNTQQIAQPSASQNQPAPIPSPTERDKLIASERVKESTFQPSDGSAKWISANSASPALRGPTGQLNLPPQCGESASITSI